MDAQHELHDITEQLALAGCVAAREEAEELLEVAGQDRGLLTEMVARRVTGEPIAWITGSVTFCQIKVHVDTGIYVPRWQSEPLALRAVERMPPTGVAIDLCTGSGAIAKTISNYLPLTKVMATDLDPRAVSCAQTNGVTAYEGDLLAPISSSFHCGIDLIVGVVPYVPTPALVLLSRDTLTFESTLAYDGGEDGLTLLRRSATEATKFLVPGGAILLEVGGDQADALSGLLDSLGYRQIVTMLDEDGDLRAIEATFQG